MEDMNVMMNETSMENEAVEAVPETIEVNPADAMESSGETTNETNVVKAIGMIAAGVAVVIIAGVGISKAVKSGHTPMNFFRRKFGNKVEENCDDAPEDFDEPVDEDVDAPAEDSDDGATE